MTLHDYGKRCQEPFSVTGIYPGVTLGGKRFLTPFPSQDCEMSFRIETAEQYQFTPITAASRPLLPVNSSLLRLCRDASDLWLFSGAVTEVEIDESGILPEQARVIYE